MNATNSAPAVRSGITISPEDKAKYTRLFHNAGPVAGLLAGEKASEILKKSRLSDEKLGQIWYIIYRKIVLLQDVLLITFIAGVSPIRNPEALLTPATL